MAAARSLPLMMVVLLMGMVRRVSRVLFSFSLPMDDMTTLPTMRITIITTRGIIILWLVMELDNA